MLVDRWRWLVVAAVALGVAMIAVVRLGDEGEPPEPVHGEVVVCAQLDAVPAEASSDGLQRAPGPEVAQDPRCDDFAAALPGGLVLPRHSEGDAAVGNVVLAGELRFDEQGRCFYVVSGGEPIGVVWPGRFTGNADPPQITDEDGSVVMSVGDRFEVRGRYVAGVAEDCGPVGVDATGFVASGDVVPTND